MSVISQFSFTIITVIWGFFDRLIFTALKCKTSVFLTKTSVFITKIKKDPREGVGDRKKCLLSKYFWAAGFDLTNGAFPKVVKGFKPFKPI